MSATEKIKNGITRSQQMNAMTRISAPVPSSNIENARKKNRISSEPRSLGAPIRGARNWVCFGKVQEEWDRMEYRLRGPREVEGGVWLVRMMSVFGVYVDSKSRTAGLGRVKRGTEMGRRYADRWRGRGPMRHVGELVHACHRSCGCAVRVTMCCWRDSCYDVGMRMWVTG